MGPGEARGVTPSAPTNPREPEPSSVAGELSSLRTQLEEFGQRVTALAERYRVTPDSQVASDLFAAERALAAARRSLARVADTITT